MVLSASFYWVQKCKTQNNQLIYVVKHMCHLDLFSTCVVYVVSSTWQFLGPWPIFGRSLRSVKLRGLINWHYILNIHFWACPWTCHMLSLKLSICKSWGWIIWRPTSWQMVKTKGFFQPQWGCAQQNSRGKQTNVEHVDRKGWISADFGWPWFWGTLAHAQGNSWAYSWVFKLFQSMSATRHK